MIDTVRRLLFIHIARTGGSSVETALVGRDWWLIDPQSKHISASQARSLYGEDIWRSHTKFSIIRNPWDRVVSMWATGRWNQKTQNLAFEPPTIKDFILALVPHRNEHYRSLHYHSILDQDLDFILRFENLQVDFSSMLTSLNLPDIRLPHVESRVRDDYRSYFDMESASLIAQLFQLDIQTYGYAF